MMITIHGLAPKTKYQDVKLLIKQECNIDDFILDYLVNDGDGTKKVRIGLPNENEGLKLMKCLNGYRMPDNSVLKVVPVGQPAAVNTEVTPQGGYDSRPGYQNQSRNDYPNQPRGEYINQSSSNDYHRGPHGPGGPRGSGGPHGTGRPHGHGGPHGPSGPHGPGGPHGPNRLHGPGGPHGSSRPHGPGEHHGSVGHLRPNALHGSNKPYGPGGPWSANNSNSSQWTSNLSMATQVPQNTFGYGTGTQPNVPPSYTEQGHSQHSRPDIRPFDQARPEPPAEQDYGGYPPKNNIPVGRQPDIRQNLRSVDSLEPVNPGPAPMHSSRYPPNQYPQEKPVTIMKDNFQGPTQYNINQPGEHQQQYPQQAAVSPWQQQGHQTQQLKAQFSKASPIGYEKGFEDRKYPQSEQARDPKNAPRPDTYKEYEKRRGFSPSGRDPLPRRLSPSRREDPIHSGPPTRVGDMGQRMGDSMQRRDDLHARRDDPHVRRDESHGRRDEPHVRRFSPTRKRTPPGERRHIPGARHESPHKRPSPTRRVVSPGRRDERPMSRFSPVRHHPEKGDKYGSDAKDLKKVRPAYDPVPSHAPNQATYSGGFRPNIRENVQYPVAGMRQEQSGLWQRHRDEPLISMKKQDDERRDSRMHMTRDRMSDQVDKHFSPSRKSRSPNRRDRSPIRDRFKRNSPSPRSSYSPRRSWALEKRRSPDAPPPPSWPGQNTDLNRHARPNFPEKDEKPKHQPVWEPRSFKEDDIRNRRLDDRRPYEEAKLRIAKDLMERPPASQMAVKDQYQREPKFSPRDEYEERRDNYRRRESPERKPHRDDFDLQRRPREEGGPDDYNRRRESPHRERKPDLPKEIDKDFEDIYHRALQFKKKTEELRKSASKKRDEFDDDRRHSDKEHDEMRQRYEDRARFREDELLRLREREERRDDRPRGDRLQDERPRDDRARDNRPREERTRDDRPRHDDDHRGEYHPRDNHEREHDKAIDDNKTKRHYFTNNAVREKRSKAIQEISDKIIDRNEDFKHVQGEQRQRIFEELKLAVARIIYDMFGDSDVSFIEIIIKYQARYTLKDEVKILQDVMRSLPKQFRTIKRHGPESTAVPAKTSRHSPIADMKQDPAPRPKLSDPSFNVNLAPPSVISMSCVGLPQTQNIMNQPMVPMMVSAPFYQSFDTLQQNVQNQVFVPKPVQPVVDFAQPVPPVLEFSQPAQPGAELPSYSEEETQEGYRLYLCKDDFERITNAEADLLKDFLISQMFKATAYYQGWSPDFTFKGLQSLYRYEVVTKDEGSKDWLLNLDFHDFEYFHVLVYSKEELWYERAAIWLPGHSRVKNIEPLDKLKLQNKKLEGVNIDKWKFVKKIVNEKGTRLYVDMPPSSARALEVHEMKLSYELQQVSVFLKAVAIDKDSFDAGLKEVSFTSPAEIAEAIKNAPMPSLTNDHALVKIILKGSKTLDLIQARKIKEVVIYNLFRYHQQNGLSRTDFLKYGILLPNYFAILPMNQESKRWLLGCTFGKVNRQSVVVIGGEEDKTRFFKMTAIVPFEYQLRAAHIVERLKTSNQGVKGINFSMWKPIRVKPIERKKARYEVEIDMESLETLSTMRYQLDYVDRTGNQTVYFRSEYSQSGLEDMIKKCKAEMMDSYDVANMDLESEESSSESNDDIICLD